ncbi:MAG: M50 family metallopeptidase [Solirubrobacteraceae bacterium]
MSWVLTILGIMALIVLHELGHFIAAKAVGMRVERFSLFFPPKLIGIKLGETEYSIGAIPAGGYVKITGMSPVELERLDLRVAERSYYLQQPWKRIVVILAGPAVNLLIAFLIFWGILLSSSFDGHARLGLLDPSTPTLRTTSEVAAVEKGMPAAGALHPGDRIVAVEGRRATPEQARVAIDSHRCAGSLTDGCSAAAPVNLTVLRGGRDVTLSLRPRYNATEKRMLIGFGFGATPRHFAAGAAATAALGEMWNTTELTLTGFVRAFTQPKVRHEVSSILGITQSANEQVKQGAGDALVFLGFISLVLAVMNLFPFLPLDGGHLLWSVAEKLRGRRISLAAMYRYSSVGIVLLLFLVINGFSNDISRLTG